jgi:predicted anti-sigma-YlaC factor YlaD
MKRQPASGPVIATILALTALPGCSLRRVAVNSLGNALAAGGSTFASDDDPELVREAVPFSLKTMEALLEESPRHRGLLLAAARGFTQYTFAFVQQEADFEEPKDLAAATALRERAVRLYLRGRDYGFRGLEVALPRFGERLRTDPASALASARREHVPLLYWTAAAWGGAMALAKSDSSLTADQHLAEALMTRALKLDESFELGAIHDFFISYEAGRSSVGGSVAGAREHLERALQLAHGQRAWPYVSFAESASVGSQDRKEFERLLREALAIDPNQAKEQRLSNLLAQRRARWLLSRADELFVE